MDIEELEEYIETIRRHFDTRVQTVNERTKTHTLDIRELRKQIKEIKKEQHQQ